MTMSTDQSAAQGVAHRIRSSIEGGQPYKLLRRFSLLSLLSVSLVFAVCSLLVTNFLTKHLVHRDAVVTMEFLQSVVDVENDIAYREGRLPDLGDRHFEQFFTHVSRLPDVLRANIYTPDRTVIWSSDAKVEVTGPVAANPELDHALRGELELEMGVAGPDDPKPERAHLSERPVHFVELYVPLRDRQRDQVIGVAELYRVPTGLFDSIREGTQLIWTFGLVAGLLLYGALFWIVRGADRTIRDQHDRLIETERFAAVGELSAAVAHGIRNPIASIRSSAELSLHDATPSATEALNDIISEVDHLERWVRELLAYSHPDRGSNTSVDLGIVVARADNAFRRECERRSIELLSAIPPAVPAVAGDEALLEQVLCSLYANAIEAMPKGGKLHIAAEVANRRRGVRLTISDTGHGIAPAQVARLFTPHATTKPKGMGLGLSLVRHIVRRLGGDVRIESVPQQGTRVILDLAPAA
jgi:signal transduction histidine kinase